MIRKRQGRNCDKQQDQNKEKIIRVGNRVQEGWNKKIQQIVMFKRFINLILDNYLKNRDLIYKERPKIE